MRLFGSSSRSRCARVTSLRCFRSRRIVDGGSRFRTRFLNASFGLEVALIFEITVNGMNRARRTETLLDWDVTGHFSRLIGGAAQIANAIGTLSHKKPRKGQFYS